MSGASTIFDRVELRQLRRIRNATKVVQRRPNNNNSFSRKQGL